MWANDKYELTDETKVVEGHVLHRIRALDDPYLEDIGIKEGTLGGWIESEENLSIDDSSWVWAPACVYGDARIEGHSKVYDNAKVYGNALISSVSTIRDNAKVYGNAFVSGSLVCGNAKVYGDAEVSSSRVYDKAKVYGNARIHGNYASSGSSVGGNSRVYGNAQIWGDISGNIRLHGDVEYSGNLDGDADIGSKEELDAFLKNKKLVTESSSRRLIKEGTSNMMKESYSKRSMLLKENEYWTQNLYNFDLPEYINSINSLEINTDIEDDIAEHNRDLIWHEMSLEQHYDGSYYVVLRYRGQGSQIEEILYDIIEDLTQNEYDSKEDFISTAKKEIQDGARISEELSEKIADKLSGYLSNNSEETYNDFDFGEKVDYNKPLYLVEGVENNILSCDFKHEYVGGGIQDDGSIEWICMDDEFDKAVKIMDEMEKDYDEFAEELKKEYGEEEEEEEEDIEESRRPHGRMLKEDSESSWAIDGFEEGNPMPSPYREVYNTKYEALDNAIALVEEYPEMCIGVRKAEAASRRDFEAPYVYCVATEENKKVAMREFGGKFIGVEG